VSIKPRDTLAYLVAVVIPLVLAAGWHLFPPILQATPGYVYLLLVALIARFLGFGPAIIFTPISAGVLWLYVLPLAFPTETQVFFLHRVLLFVAASIVIASIGQQRSERMREAEETYRSVVELSPDAIGVSDENAKIVFANTALAKLVGAASVADVIGRKTLDFTHPDSREVARERIAQLAAGHPAPWLESKWIRLDGSPIDVETAGVPVRKDGKLLYQEFVRDVTERKNAERALQQLSGRVLLLQDEERRRIALQLHDTTAQNLIALKLNLARAMQSVAMGDELKKTVDQSLALVDQSIEEIRTLSYLLHPPLIEEVGLVASLQWYVRGFEERTAIRVALEAASDIRRLPKAVERAGFRIVQEALTNIQRHSQSECATVRLTRSVDGVRLVVEDKGRGFPDRLRGQPLDVVTAAGIGVASMYQRARDLGGTMKIHSDDRGTRVEVELPTRDISERHAAHPDR
jgi:PAS domain S-box-containing protein